MKISDEIRNDFLRNDDVGEVAYRQLLCIADRIDRDMVELPKDADGVREGYLIERMLGAVVYGNPGVAWKVVGLRMSKFGWKVETNGAPFALEPDELTHKKPEPADSWEKLEEDARKIPCDYALAPRDEDGIRTCDGCRFEKSESCSQEMKLDILKRAKKLADDYHARYCPNCGAEVASR